MFEEVDEGHSEDDNGLHFFYNREERLKNAPQIVKDYYDGKMKPTRGLFRVLVSTPANRFLFFAMVILTAFALIYGKVTAGTSKTDISGVKFELSSFSYDEEVFSTIKVTAKEDIIKDPKKVTAVFYLTDADSQITEGVETELLLTKTEDYLRLKTSDYEYVKASAVVKLGPESVELECPVKR